MTELNLIQTQLVSKKSNYNDFSKFNYRSLEDIMANVKPLLQSYGCTIVFSDELVLIGDRYYIKATCTLKNSSGEQEQAVAYAREPETLKGMSEPQVTGTASSYARKYAVCSLLAIDDNKDVDSMDNRDTTPKTAYKQANTEDRMNKLLAQLQGGYKRVYQTVDKKQIDEFYRYWEGEIKSGNYKSDNFQFDKHFNNKFKRAS